MEKIKKYEPLINIQIAIAFAISIYLALILNLENAITAGVVTLLSIQTTKKQTVEIAGKRILGFIIMLVLVIIIFNFLGYNLPAFAIFVFIFSILNSGLNISIGLAPNVVMAGHFYAIKTTELSFILNETLIYFIGVGVAIVINLLIPMMRDSNEEKNNIDYIVKRMITIIANYLDEKFIIDGNICSKDEYIEYIEKYKTNIDIYIEKYEKNIIENIENNIFDNNLYDLEYLNMRKNQIVFLVRIIDAVLRLEQKVPQSSKISNFLREIHTDFDEKNTAFYLIESSDKILKEFRESELPKTRIEFENRAILYSIMEDIKSFLFEKYNFINKERYEN